MKEKNIDPLFEWAVWGHLQSKTDLELILLKGHLLLEMTIETSLKRHDINDIENFSFYKKIIELEKCMSTDFKNKELIIDSLVQINKLRNKLAHEFEFEIKESSFKDWSQNIISNLDGMKWSKYTNRTKIIHAFSILAINILNAKK